MLQELERDPHILDPIPEKLHSLMSPTAATLAQQLQDEEHACSSSPLQKPSLRFRTSAVVAPLPDDVALTIPNPTALSSEEDTPQPSARSPCTLPPIFPIPKVV
ncbi:hypothetical protein EON66_09340 [archaeon]|nr:MAG: hypothetical protein EON66_09340 [archaeon]